MRSRKRRKYSPLKILSALVSVGLVGYLAFTAQVFSSAQLAAAAGSDPANGQCPSVKADYTCKKGQKSKKERLQTAMAIAN